jgi:hypothetical protein
MWGHVRSIYGDKTCGIGDFISPDLYTSCSCDEGDVFIVVIILVPGRRL